LLESRSETRPAGLVLPKRGYLAPIDFQEFFPQRTVPKIKIKAFSKTSFPIVGDDAFFFSHFAGPPFI
jgi:hypothetical protein